MGMWASYYGFFLLVLFSFFQGVSNVYLGGMSGDLRHLDHLPVTLLTSMSSYLFVGNGLGCLVGSAMVDRYGAARVCAVFLCVAGLGYLCFSLSHDFYSLSLSQFLVGVGVSVYQSSGIQMIKTHF